MKASAAMMWGGGVFAAVWVKKPGVLRVSKC